MHACSTSMELIAAPRNAAHTFRACVKDEEVRSGSIWTKRSVLEAYDAESQPFVAETHFDDARSAAG